MIEQEFARLFLNPSTCNGVRHGDVARRVLPWPTDEVSVIPNALQRYSRGPPMKWLFLNGRRFSKTTTGRLVSPEGIEGGIEYWTRFTEESERSKTKVHHYCFPGLNQDDEPAWYGKQNDTDWALLRPSGSPLVPTLSRDESAARMIFPFADAIGFRHNVVAGHSTFVKSTMEI